ncbi:MAG: ABC transporter ATP-binding protein [Spirulinaceae cyanobacterium SM2_1_0]|nr:ABC transporter ATP-binding protein [Spirulinaceae cyanobacterium SM2_1_0]
MAAIRLQDLARRYGKTAALEDITFTVPDGEFWVLVGPSGCGKSTVLRLIAGLDQPTAGQIYLGDRLINLIPARQRDVAMVFQNYALYPHMTVAENLDFGLRMRQLPVSQRRQRVEAVASSLAIDHLLDRKPPQLSGGQQQRVALGRAIAREPAAFLLDEPLSNLDAQLRDRTRTELKQLHARLGVTTLYVTHDQVEAMTLGDQVVVLDQGRIQQIGPPQAIYAQPVNRMVATFLGSPPMNILPATYADGVFRIGRQALPCLPAVQQALQPRDGEGFALGLRPEAMQIGDQPSSRRAPLTARLETLEPLGREILAIAQLPEVDAAIAFYAPGDWPGQPGTVYNLQCDLAQLFVFDASSGDTRYPPASPTD